MGAAPTIVPGPILLSDTAFHAEAEPTEDAYMHGASVELDLQSNPEKLTPCIVLVKPDTTSYCDDIIVDASLSTGGAQRNLEFQWEFVPYSTSVDCAEMNALYGEWNVSNQLISLSNTLFLAGNRFSGTLTARNFIEEYNEIEITFDVDTE